MVLTFESTIAFIACRKPSSTASRSDLPWTSSSRMRSKISTFASTAMPIDKTKPASPGSVSVKPNSASPARVNRQYSVSAATARAPDPVIADHDHDHEQNPDDPRQHTIVNGVGAERRGDGPLVDDRERCRQRPGAQH